MRVLSALHRPKYLPIICSALVMGVVLSPLAFTRVEGRGQGGDKVVEKLKDFDPPVEIDLIRSDIGDIEPGRKFAAGGRWFKGLTVRLRNKSAKNITHISVGLLFPRPQAQESEPDFLEILEYGASPVPLPNGEIPHNTARAVMPDESVELRLTDDAYESVTAALSSAGYPADIKKLKVYVRMLGFSDGTLWKAGDYYERDKSSPDKLSLKKSPEDVKSDW